MVKRPLCAAALVWAAVLWILGSTGSPVFSRTAPVLPDTASTEQAKITGIIYKKETYPYSTNLYLNQTNLIFRSETYPIDHVKIHISNSDLKEDLSPGDRILSKGDLEQIPLPGNPGQFHERNYYYARKIKWMQEGKKIILLRKKEKRLLAWQEQMKEILKKGISKSFPEGYRGIIEAVLLGERAKTEREQKLLFQIMGISHILAISGVQTLFLA